VILEDIDTVIYAFPADRRLKGLHRLGSTGSRVNLLRRLFGKQPAYGHGTLETLRYKPERRYVARLDAPDGRRAAVKFYNTGGYRAALHAAQAFASGEALRLLPCAGHMNRYQVLAFDWQPATPLHALLSATDRAESDKARALELTGAALAELHGQTAVPLEPWTRRAERARLQAQAGTLGHLCPELRGVADRLARDCAARLEETPPDRGALHGDFNAEQVLIGDDGRATVLDLDWARQGNPAADLGLFAAHLERSWARGILSRGQVDAYTEALGAGYGGAGKRPPAAAIRLYTAIGAFYLAAEPFRYRETDWPARVEALLGRARAILDDSPAESMTHGVSNAR
jgi:hypothetical protein